MNKRFRFSRRSKLIAVAIGAILVIAMVGVALAAAFAVDTFNTGTLNLGVNSSAPTVQSGIDPSTDALGGDREATLTWTSGSGAASLLVNDFSSQRLNFNTANGVAADAVIRWDGIDNQATVNNQLLNENLTGGGTNNAFDIEIVNDDLPVIMKIRVYNGTGNFSERTINLPGGILFPNVHVDYVVPFGPGNGWIDTGTGASWTAATSIELEIDNSITPGADVSIDSFNLDNFRDYGDLPTSGVANPYSAAILNASHIPQGLRLGGSVDVEAGPQPNVNAGTATAGDNNAVAPGFNDEEGVAPVPGFKWSVLGGGRVQVTVSGADVNNGAYLNGWIDWGNDGGFGQANDQIITDRNIFNGANQVINFTIPAGVTFPNSFYARFRICQAAGQCNTVTAVDVLNGEVEDYQWGFGPLAVTLTNLEAKADTQNNAAAVVLVATVVLALVITGLVIRRRTA